MDRQGKKDFVARLTQVCDEYSCVVLVRQVGLNADAVNHLRQKAHQSQVKVLVVKNTLAKRALESRYASLAKHVSGPVALVYSHDAITAAKVVDEFGKKREKHFSAIAAVLEGQEVDVKRISMLASIHSADHVRAQLLSVLTSAASGFVSVLAAGPSAFARLLQARQESVQ